MKKLIRRIGTMFWIRYYLKHFQWYRRWHGGRWEYWWIEICASYMWLTMRADLPDDYREPCSAGPRLAREDW